MKSTLKSGRILLDQESLESVNQMHKILNQENPYLKSSPSKLVSFIVSYFKAHSFEKEKDYLKCKLLDQRAYLKSLVHSEKATDQIIDEVLKLRKKKPLRA